MWFYSHTRQSAKLRLDLEICGCQCQVAEAEARDQVEAQLRHIQKMERVGQLTGDFAHDFNNMLAIVIGSLDLRRRRRSGAGDDKALRYGDDARERAQTAAMLTARLLAFAPSSHSKRFLIPIASSVACPSKSIER
ncbi:hypothetical protein SKP52_01065 [Sphingopyxis fribergensis]|uniref:Signal transduction histidine kinase dimerisation/phosphoacceptor domain-containing protein n=1 Tax=Sphingopyxis fribergensis TaxID=1515612 RepID=A0A0A7PB04_9SPHN|nr:hypothetical protein SKP52_01065 [Sphingopyxis fribergensis]